MRCSLGHFVGGGDERLQGWSRGRCVLVLPLREKRKWQIILPPQTAPQITSFS